MKSEPIFSNKQILNNYFRLIYLLTSDKSKTLSSIKTTIYLKLHHKKFLVRFYKKLLKFNTINKFINSYIVFSFSILKRYLVSYIPWAILASFNVRNLFFFLYHFLTVYKAIFTIKMILDWFPVKNWDRASPLKRFLRRVSIDWAKQFERYFPSFYAWLIVINIIPILLSLLQTFYVTHDFTQFPTQYNFDEILEFVLESNRLT